MVGPTSEKSEEDQVYREEYTQHLDDIQRIIESIKIFQPTKCEVKST